MLSAAWFLSCDAVVPLTSAVNRNNQMNAAETTANCWLSCRSSWQIPCTDVNWNHKANLQRSPRDASSYVYVRREQREDITFRSGALCLFFYLGIVKENQLQILFFMESTPENIISGKTSHKSPFKRTVYKHTYKNIFKNCV